MSYTKGFHCDISVHAYFDQIHHHPPILLFLIPPFLFKQLSLGFIVLFSYMRMEYYNHIHPPLPILSPSPFHAGSGLLVETKACLVTCLATYTLGILFFFSSIISAHFCERSSGLQSTLSHHSQKDNLGFNICALPFQVFSLCKMVSSWLCLQHSVLFGALVLPNTQISQFSRSR
jgi:hypothetical protein